MAGRGAALDDLFVKIFGKVFVKAFVQVFVKLFGKVFGKIFVTVYSNLPTVKKTAISIELLVMAHNIIL